MRIPSRPVNVNQDRASPPPRERRGRGRLGRNPTRRDRKPPLKHVARQNQLKHRGLRHRRALQHPPSRSRNRTRRSIRQRKDELHQS